MAGHTLLHRLRDVVENHPAIFESERAREVDASDPSHGAFYFRERNPDVPPWRLYVSCPTKESPVVLEEGEQIPNPDPEHQRQEEIKQSALKLHEMAKEQYPEELGGLQWID